MEKTEERKKKKNREDNFLMIKQFFNEKNE